MIDTHRTITIQAFQSIATRSTIKRHTHWTIMVPRPPGDILCNCKALNMFWLLEGLNSVSRAYIQDSPQILYQFQLVEKCFSVISVDTLSFMCLLACVILPLPYSHFSTSSLLSYPVYYPLILRTICIMQQLNVRVLYLSQCTGMYFMHVVQPDGIKSHMDLGLLLH